MEFHISRPARDRYAFDQSLFSYSGNVVFANFHAVRLFVQKMNQQRDLVNYPETAIRASEVNALGLIDEILHHVIHDYRLQRNPDVMSLALETLGQQIGAQALEGTLHAFATEFPPLAVYRREQTLDEYLAGATEGTPNREILLEELLMLWVTNQNPATEPYAELFSDARLQSETAYNRLMAALYAFFETQLRFGPDHQNLIDMLRAPARANPHSLEGQLEFIRERWSDVLGRYLYRLLTSLDLIKEEHKITFTGPGPVLIPTYDHAASEVEPERFSQDREWMPRLVLMAKNSYVWLDQLSRQYQQPITRLDQIPDEELDLLAQRGFTGLWLIGLWERSRASARIKKIMGNSDAVASAYSLWNYGIAGDLGGEAAYNDLRERAARRGIRLASDMVPNHMGIDSPWVMDHPDWFLSLNYSPFPSYSFNGPDLSSDGHVGVFLEDHYYDRSDAAVVFKRIDRSNGDERYIYHGNDGTSMPWNDTAQLNYFNPEAREAVIQTILHVARMFPIIRFDAAMTLAKKHFQRLWFPEPGTGGAIATRSEHGLTREQFDALMPAEFWREVVDRAAVEAPDTLLLAEAFWMMESYFVRTLGMHRVYNSAFMNILRNEDNAKYRLIMKNTLEFDPEILKRYVNFMNNPDERTAVDQFGKGDKYFGICILMITMPGLPMFGHGQIEGFSEKYGMEFRKPLWDEQVDPFLVERHQREIFPILHRRAAFAGVENFLLYDFYTPEGPVDENVFAYSNGLGDERNLVVYNNRFNSTRGWVRVSVAYMDKSTRQVRQRTLGEALAIQPGDPRYLIYRDQTTGLEYLQRAADVYENGLYFELNAYKAQVLLDFRQIEDDPWGSLRELNTYLNGRGVPSIQEAMQQLLLRPVQQPFREISNPGYLSYLIDQVKNGLPPAPELLTEAQGKLGNFLAGIHHLTGHNHERDELLRITSQTLSAAFTLPDITKKYPLPGSRAYAAAAQNISTGLLEKADPGRWVVLFSYVFTHRLGNLANTEASASQTITWIDEWQFGRILTNAALGMGLDEEVARRLPGKLKMLISQQDWYERLGNKSLSAILQAWLADEDAQRFLGINRFQGVIWYNQEAFQVFLWWMLVLAVLSADTTPRLSAVEFVERVIAAYDITQSLLKAGETSAYQVDKLLAAVEPDASPTPAETSPDAAGPE